MAMACQIGSVPDDVLLTTVITTLRDARDLCALGSSGKRYRALAGCESLWNALFDERWGVATKLQRRAASLAGGYKSLYASKHCTDKTAHPWTKPAPEEIRASVEKLAARVRDEEQQVAALAGWAPNLMGSGLEEAGGGADAGQAAAAAAAAAGSGGGGGSAVPLGVGLSAWGEQPEDRYLALCVREEAPW
ncbi:hypothetical protein TSOC_006999 [Tetrabaena socialis]|uniref:F-box domain-containing protein n=1 Tax=Tetrabaena socialis TaxID=47790 RepID=A0A2J8A287_9CHLO|nr:hypothetical protein TSOC_006999 [Tetrabaena socialis]|eukprot:PNH06615.1 hypothetical protein TSOC_006999 [Tetrabaena socialis]